MKHLLPHSPHFGSASWRGRRTMTVKVKHIREKPPRQQGSFTMDNTLYPMGRCNGAGRTKLWAGPTITTTSPGHSSAPIGRPERVKYAIAPIHASICACAVHPHPARLLHTCPTVKKMETATANQQASQPANVGSLLQGWLICPCLCWQCSSWHRSPTVPTYPCFVLVSLSAAFLSGGVNREGQGREGDGGKERGSPY